MTLPVRGRPLELFGPYRRLTDVTTMAMTATARLRPWAGTLGLLLAVYIAGISSVWARGLSIDCGCFSKGGQLAPGQHPNYLWDIVRDVALLAVAVFLFLTPRTRISVDSYLSGSGGDYE